MDLSEWRKQQNEGEQFVTPSGLDVWLRRVHVLEVVQSGDIPQVIQPLISSMLGIGEDRKVDDLVGMKDYMAMVDFFVSKALVRPEVEPTELPWPDRDAIFDWMQASDGEVRLFRPEEKESMGAARNGKDVRAATEFSVGPLSSVMDGVSSGSGNFSVGQMDRKSPG